MPEITKWAGSTASSVQPRNRLDHHQSQIRALQAAILEHERAIAELRAKIHNHLSCVDLLFRSTVCLTVAEHERLERALGDC